MKQNFIELITVPFQAGESKLFAISGQYFELIDATNPVDVVLSNRDGAQVGLMRQAEASFNLKGTEFQTVQITSQTGQTIRFAYGTGEAGTRRSAGIVQVVDGGKARTLGNYSFTGYVNSNAVAAQFSQVQLWNPVGSGRRVIVEQCTGGSGVATALYYGINAVALSNLIGSPPSKLSGGAPSNAQMRSEANAVAAFPSTQSLIAKINPVGYEMQWEPREPVVLLPGYGLVARPGVVNQDAFSSFEFYEEPV